MLPEARVSWLGEATRRWSQEPARFTGLIRANCDGSLWCNRFKIVLGPGEIFGHGALAAFEASSLTLSLLILAHFKSNLLKIRSARVRLSQENATAIVEYLFIAIS